jgi:hypothetical protein
MRKKENQGETNREEKDRERKRSKVIKREGELIKEKES